MWGTVSVALHFLTHESYGYAKLLEDVRYGGEQKLLYNVMQAKHNSGISLWGVDNDWNMFICGSFHSIDKF